MINISGYNFSDPWKIDDQPVISKAGLYAVVILGTESGKWPILYIGQSGNVGSRLDYSHHKRSCWEREANGKTLYACFYPMPSDKFPEEDRLKLETYLMHLINPPCNG